MEKYTDTQIEDLNIFPVGWLVCTISMSALITTITNPGEYQAMGHLDTNALKFIGFLTSVLLASIPMTIAWKRNTKHKRLVYLCSFLGSWFVGGLLWLISALMLAIVDKKENQ